MERLFAGWRMKFVERAGKAPDGCLFCALHTRGDDARRYVVERGPKAFIVLNAFPYNSGHLMVAVNRHVGTIAGLTAAERADVWRLLARAERALGKAYKPEGLNVGINQGRAAGAGVLDHLHVHLVPRWIGDTNFMTAVGDAKVMPEDLDATYKRIRRALAALRG
ncbi:MAG: HIT family protein [Candidatus Eiseniibacteriota bacterium]